MDNEFPITLVILDRPYKMKVTAEEEETIRKLCFPNVNLQFATTIKKL